jgi:hypothetical protein
MPGSRQDWLAPFHEMYITRQLTDVVLTVGDRSVAAHRNMLAAVSERWKAQFCGGMVESSVRTMSSGRLEVAVEGVGWDALKAIVDSVYTGKLALSGSAVVAIIQAANLLQVQAVERAAVDFLVARLDAGNVLSAMQLGETRAHGIWGTGNSLDPPPRRRLTHLRAVYAEFSGGLPALLSSLHGWKSTLRCACSVHASARSELEGRVSPNASLIASLRAAGEHLSAGGIGRALGDRSRAWLGKNFGRARPPGAFTRASRLHRHMCSPLYGAWVWVRAEGAHRSKPAGSGRAVVAAEPSFLALPAAELANLLKVGLHRAGQRRAPRPGLFHCESPVLEFALQGS